MKQVIIFIALLLTSLLANAQSNIDAVLAQVERNNKTLVANKQLVAAKKLEHRTGISLPDPKAEYEYLWGTPENIGNQTDLVVYQPFDFPSSYIKRKQAADLQAELEDYFIQSQRQQILLQAKKICIELVYRHKLKALLDQRKVQTQKLATDFQTRLDKGFANQIEVNKAKLQALQIQSSAALNEMQITKLNVQLTELNGGNAIAITDTVYPLIPDLPAFDALEKTIEGADPVRKSFEQQQLIEQKQVELSKSLWLPSFEAGYRYQNIPGQQFNGLHLGIGIPLWERKNTVRTQQAELLFATYETDEHRTEHYHEIKQFYDEYQSLRNIVDMYRTQLASIDNSRLITKAFELGELSSAEYFTEISYFNSSIDTYFELEMQMQKVVAELLSYQL